MLQEARGFRNQRTEGNESQAGRQIQKPHDSPTEEWLQQRGEFARGKISADRADAPDEYETPAAMPSGRNFREQRVCDRQHAAGGRSHQEAHGDVP